MRVAARVDIGAPQLRVFASETHVRRSARMDAPVPVSGSWYEVAEAALPIGAGARTICY